MDSYYQKNKARILARLKERYAANPDLFKQRAKAWAKKNPIRRKETAKAGHKRRMAIDPSKRRKWYANWVRNKRASDPNFRLEQACRSRIQHALKALKKSANTESLIGCSTEFLKAHIEMKFSPGMGWHNHGRFGWHVDHIIPCASFDLSVPEQQRKCFHFTNLQPLWWNENLVKSDKVV